jgi:serine/threonine protein kinase
MDSSPSDRNPVEELAEDFVARFRRGERPSLTEYAERHPQWADQIRTLFPALVVMEKVHPGAADGTAPEADVSRTVVRPERLGDYRIVREVGRGGMGVVYEAEQESLGRHVALKVLPAHAVLDPRHHQRFKREARAAARLHHTNIVPVYGVGEQDGLHYYVMQFIRGLGLNDVLAELKRLRQVQQQSPSDSARACDPSAAVVARSLLTGQFGRDRPEAADAVPVAGPASTLTELHLPGQTEGSTLSQCGRPYWHSVARIGLQVADALAFAASQGILHRDIKPSNLLLDIRGTVWVTDFGLAKAETDVDDVTHTGDVVGTVRYMAPERFQGGADVRSDLYALGLTLYELLTLRPAFAETDRNKLMAQVMHEQPLGPRSLAPNIPRDLETIVLKAIARAPAHRYQTAAELADDLQRFLDDRPIKARRLNLAQRGWRWCRRKPALAAVSAGLVLVLVGGVAGVGWQWWRAESEATVARRERNEAETSFRQALDAVDEFCTQVSQDVLLNEPGMQPLRRKLLASARDYYETFVARRDGDARARVQLGRAKVRLAVLAADLDGKAQARHLYEEAIAYLEYLNRDFPGVAEYRDALAIGYGDFAVLLLELNEPRRAEELFRQGLAVEDGLMAADPSAHCFAEARVRLRHGRGRSLVDLREFAAAEGVLREALAERQRLVRAVPANDEYLAGEADTQQELGHLFHITGRTTEAEAARLAVLMIRQGLHDKQPNGPGHLAALAAGHQDLGLLYHDIKDLNKAQASFEKALEHSTALLAANPRVARYQAAVAVNHYHVGVVLQLASQLTEAESALMRALAIQRQLVRDYADEPTFRRDLGRTHQVLGLVYADTGPPDKARQAYHEALACHERVVSEHPDYVEARQDLANAHNSAGWHLRGEGDQFGAQKEFAKARDLFDELNARKPGVLECQQRRVWTNYNLALVYKDTDRLDLAERTFRDTLAAINELAQMYPHVKSIPMVRGRTFSNLGHVLRDGGKCQDALPWYTQAEEQLLALRKADDRNSVTRDALWSMYWGRAQTFEKLGRPADALADWDRALELVSKKDFRRDVRLLRAVVTANLGDHAVALAVLEEFAKDPSKTGGLDYKRARLSAAVAAALRRDTAVPAADRDNRATALEARAVELLRQANSKGHFNPAFEANEFKEDPAFAPLRNRPDFQDLLRDVESKPRATQGAGPC